MPMSWALGNVMQGKNSKHINGLYSFFEFGRFQGDFRWFEPGLEVAEDSKMTNFESENAKFLSLEPLP